MNGPKIYFTIPLFGGIPITQTTVSSFAVMLLLCIAGIVLGEYSVKSGWFNSETMLYMAFVTIANYSQSSFELGYALKFMRVIMLLFTAVFDVWGYIIGFVIAVCAIVFNKTIGTPVYQSEDGADQCGRAGG